MSKIAELDPFADAGIKFLNPWLVKQAVAFMITKLKRVEKHEGEKDTSFWVLGATLLHLPAGVEQANGYAILGANEARDAMFSHALENDLLPIGPVRMVAIQGTGPQPYYSLVDVDDEAA